MPLHKQPHSLMKLSLRAFTGALQRYQLFMLGLEILIPVFKDFDPDLMVSALGDGLGPVSFQNYLMILSMFLPYQIRKLSVKGLVDCAPLDLATFKTFSNVEVLYLTSCCIPTTGMSHLLPIYANIIQLTLPDVGTSDFDLVSIGTACKQLGHLELDCTRFTDDGIGAFSEVIGIHNMIDTIIFRTGTVLHEDVQYTWKAYAMILSVSPNLKRFEFRLCDLNYFDLIVDYLTGEHKDINNPYSIEEFKHLEIRFSDNFHSETNTDSIQKFVNLFPKVRSFYLENEDFLLVSNLNRFDHLNEIKLLEISTNLCHLLFQTVGTQITKLKLSVCNFNLLNLGHNCTGLDHLELDCCNFSHLTLAQCSESHFIGLKKLKLRDDYFDDQSVRQRIKTMQGLRYVLLHAKNLKDLAIDQSHGIAGEFMMGEVFRVNRMGIETLHLEHCSRVWPHDIEMMLRAPTSQLKCLTIRKCGMIAQSDFDFFQHLIRICNLDVSLEFTDYWADDNGDDEWDAEE